MYTEEKGIKRNKGTGSVLYRCANGARFEDLTEAINYSIANNLPVAEMTQKDDTPEIVLNVTHFGETKGHWFNIDGSEDSLECWVEAEPAHDEYAVDLVRGGFTECRDFRVMRKDGTKLEGEELFALGADKVFALYYGLN